jgi:hypothetical protein
MSRCLSDRALLHLHVGDGTAAQRAHRDACATCANRAAALRRDVGRMSAVLTETTEPRSRRAPAARRWLPAIGVAAMAMAAALWVETTHWQPVTPHPPAGRTPEVASLLRDVSSVMFSVSGDPGQSGPDLLGDSGTSGVLEVGCDPADWSALSCTASWEPTGGS